MELGELIIAKKKKIEYHYYFLDSKRSRESLKQHFKKLGAKNFKESIQEYKSGKTRYRLGVNKKYV